MKYAGNRKADLRIKRAFRVRRKTTGTTERPRLSVRKTNRNIMVQLIDDEQGKTLAAVSTLDKEFQKTDVAKKNKESAKKLGEAIADKALKLNVKEVIFDRGFSKYHGILAELAEGARQKGLIF